MGQMNGLVLDVLGAAVALRAPAPVMAELRVVLADLEAHADPTKLLELVEVPDGFALLDDGGVVRSGITPALAVATVMWRINTIAATDTDHVLVHAGCVAGESAVLLPGPSGAGKSTLTAACIAAGLAYLSDEYAALDLRSSALVPYPKPLGLDGERLVAASALRAHSLGSTCPPAGIIFPRYEPGARLSVTPLSQGWTLLALAAHTTNLAALGGSAFVRLAGMAAACPAWQITYRAAAEAVPAVREAAAAQAVDARPAEVFGPITPTTTTVVMGDELAVLHEPTGRVHLLNTSASVVWACVPDAPDVAGLTELALAGAPDGTLDRGGVAAAVDHLTRSGLLPTAWSIPPDRGRHGRL